MKLISQYWRGVLRRLQAEVEDFNNLITHRGEKGRENELSIARMLENLMPARYGVGSGILFDSLGNESWQTDIVLFDAVDEPAILAQTNQVLFPVENVRATIEIKTNINKAEIVNIGDKVEKVRTLKPTIGEVPLFCAVGYRSVIGLDTAATHFNDLKTDEYDRRPDLFLILDAAIIGMSQSLAADLGYEVSDGEDYLLGATPLQVQDSGEPVYGKYVRVEDDEGSTAILHEGNYYAVHEVAGNEYLADSARALLLFCEALISTLATKSSRAKPGFHHYITTEMRDTMKIPNAFN